MKLYSYWRSSAAYRVRLALAYKQIAAEIIPVHLLQGGGQQHGQEYHALNPQELVPTLIDGPVVLGQSLAIMDYLEEQYPAIPLLPPDAAGRARVRQLAQIIACDTHPLNNLRVMRYLKNQLNIEEEQRNVWYAHWLNQGLTALEEIIANSRFTGLFCHGDSLSLADCTLVPQLYNARRYHVSLTPYPTLLRIEVACLALPQLAMAAPDQQPDAEPQF